MARYNTKRKNKAKSRRRKIFVAYIVIWLVAAPFTAEVVNGLLLGIFNGYQFQFSFDYGECLKLFFADTVRHRLFLSYTIIFSCMAIMLFYRPETDIGNAEVMQIAKGIWIPVPAGSGEFGTAHFMSQKEMDEKFSIAVHSGNSNLKGLQENVGIIVNYEKRLGKEYIWYLDEPVNTILLGATRSGKGRRILIQSIWLNIIAGVNLLVTDVKGEMFAYTSPFAKENGYEVRTLDFRFPEKSDHYNYMEEINQLLREGNITKAVNKAWDIVTILVGEPQGERIWSDGQCATIVAAILIVSWDAPEKCKNLANVYYFLAYMCEPDPETGEMAITDYLNNLPSNHPARGAFQIAKIAPFRTRSSFFTSALATLRLFTDWNVADITSRSDYTLSDIDTKKVITYIILPEEKTTFHPLAAIYMKQTYESLVEQAIKRGGELDRKYIIRADEVGNFPKIPDMGAMVSAGAGRNIFLELVLQDYQQLEGKYKSDFRNIKTNCQLTICLKATEEGTIKSISNQLGTYTIQTSSASTSINDGKANTLNISSSKNLTGRPLMYPDEVADLESPDALILYGGKKAIVNLPDISKWKANKILGMGSKAHNKKLFLERMEERPSSEIGEPYLWGIWEDFGAESYVDDEDRKVTFL